MHNWTKGTKEPLKHPSDTKHAFPSMSNTKNALLIGVYVHKHMYIQIHINGN